MNGLLRKKDLVSSMGVAKSTISDWLTEFHVYIPAVKQGAVIYYKPETLEILKAIQQLRQQGQSKVQIMEELAKSGFPITVEEAVEDMKEVLSQVNPRDNLLKVMETTAQAVNQLVIQDGAIRGLKDEQSKTDGRLTEIEEQLRAVQAELAATREALAEANAPKSFWRRVFGK